jgi:hypothetical protein
MPKRGQKRIKNQESPSFAKATEGKGIKNKNTGRADLNQPPLADKVNDENADQDKRMFMWVAISCLMVIFFVIWIVNLKHEFKISADKSAGGFDWSQTKVELDKAMTQVKQGIAEIKKIQTGVNQKAEASQPKLTPVQLNLLGSKLLEEAAAGTESSSKK